MAVIGGQAWTLPVSSGDERSGNRAFSLVQ